MRGAGWVDARGWAAACGSGRWTKCGCNAHNNNRGHSLAVGSIYVSYSTICMNNWSDWSLKPRGQSPTNQSRPWPGLFDRFLLSCVLRIPILHINKQRWILTFLKAIWNKVAITRTGLVSASCNRQLIKICSNFFDGENTQVHYNEKQSLTTYIWSIQQAFIELSIFNMFIFFVSCNFRTYAIVKFMT